MQEPASTSPPSSSHSHRRPWQTHSNRTPSHPQPLESSSVARAPSRVSASATASSARSTKWWRIRFFRGMVNDIKRRAPYYWSDWTDAWDYRVVPATVYMYFANILPALAFSLDMFEKTNQSYGVNEVLLASVLGAVVFSLFAAQPLVIVGVTGMLLPSVGLREEKADDVKVLSRCLTTRFMILFRRAGRHISPSCVGLECECLHHFDSNRLEWNWR